MITSDPNSHWKKVLIVNTDIDIATFRSITGNPDYMPKKGTKAWRRVVAG